MLNSDLCERIELCKSIEKLNKDGCWEVIRLMSNITNNSVNRFLISIVLNSNGILCNNHLQTFGKELQHLISSNSQYIQQPSEGNICQTTQKEEKDQLFPLLRLPIDLIKNTSLYLHEEDIFQFEQCCRLFYKMISNTTYLNESNNFKAFRIDDKRFEQLMQSQHSFFKYSKAMILQFSNSTNVSPKHSAEEIEEFFHGIQNKWNKIQTIGRNNDLFHNIFKSIKSLRFDPDGMALLSQIPMQILFDHESVLETIVFDHYWNRYDITQYETLTMEFEQKYLSFKNEMEQHGKKIKKLRLILHQNSSQGSCMIGLRHISANHLSFGTVAMTIKACDVIDVSTITCDSWVKFKLSDEDNTKLLLQLLSDEPKNINININSNVVIETLRLVNCASFMNICSDTNLIQSFNLHQTCKNLLLEIHSNCITSDDWKKFQMAIEAVLDKQDYYNLENFILLLVFQEHMSKLLQLSRIDWFFGLLKSKKRLLKYQFKQFNIGLRDMTYDVYHVMEWNQDIDDEYLDKIWNQCKEKRNVFNMDTCSLKKPQNCQKYHAWLNQWS